VTPAPLQNFGFDILAPGLGVVFCGINPPPATAANGLSFVSASNRFWQVVHLAGFTDVRLRPEEGQRLLDYRCGLTAVVGRPTQRADEVSPAEFRSARSTFEAKIYDFDPRAIAFLGKRALSAMLGRSDVAWGLQADAFAGRPAWVLPNPSGLNRSFSLDALVRAYAELHLALQQPVSSGRGPSRDDEPVAKGSRP
jgi:TDG/mug DNA glycosylase family protein